MNKQLTCAERVEASLESTMDDLRRLWEAYCDGDEDRYSDDIGNIFEYGLAFDYVAAGTFRDQEVGFFRYQLSYGGPQEEFRIFTDPEFNVSLIEYWFLDWFDGASIDLTGKEFKLVEEIFQSFFVESGAAQAEYEKAVE